LQHCIIYCMYFPLHCPIYIYSNVEHIYKYMYIYIYVYV
jgi:hypothetical protein